MKTPEQKLARFFCCLLSAACCLFFVSGCGYTIHGRGSLPFKAVTIGKLINKTFEPRLEDKMQLALADELIKQGFAIESAADHKIEGIINTFELRSLSIKSGITMEYEVIIRGYFRMVTPDGKTKELRNSGVYLVSFLSTDTIQSVMASKEKAIEQALRDLSSEITASIIYQ